jgi:hypothetical protein
MAFLLAAVLIVLSTGVLVYPFLKRRISQANDVLKDDIAEVDREMESLVEDMRILQLDHQSGNIPDGLYQEQMRAYRLQAASHLRQQTEGQPMDADRNLEQEVLMARLMSQSQDSPEDAESAPDSQDGADS